MKVKWQSDAPKMELKVPSEVKIDGYIPTAEDLTFTGNFDSFRTGKMAWLLEHYGTKITTKELTAASFNGSPKIKSIPITLNFKTRTNNSYSFDYMFQGCYALETPPRINAAIEDPRFGISSMREMFYNCHLLKELPRDYFDNIVFYNDYGIKSNSRFNEIFSYCYNLRHIDCAWVSRLPTVRYPEYSFYSGSFHSCSYLYDINDLGITSDVYTTNYFNDILNRNARLRHFTFSKNVVAKWKSQDIVIVYYVGYKDNSSNSDYVKYNIFPKEKEIKDDATYQALKDDPDAWTAKPEYAFYNHDSAVETINSLPDTSAYLTEKGGTNTITFRGNAGSKTDGGAINTMTAEEIAVAAAKGWTVTFS